MDDASSDDAFDPLADQAVSVTTTDDDTAGFTVTESGGSTSVSETGTTDTFDVVWGQDAWCYITDKERLIHECARVVKPGGAVAFTDWLETGPMTEEEWTALHAFMVFPYIETLEGYANLAEAAGLTVVEKEDLTPDFAEHCQMYLGMLQNDLKPGIIEAYGQEMYAAVEGGLVLWRDSSAEGKVGRGRIVARRPA